MLKSKLDAVNDELINAAALGNVMALRQCIDNGANVNYKNSNGKTALMYAFAYGRENAAIVLLDLGADPDIQHPKGDTAIAMAPCTLIDFVTFFAAHNGKIDFFLCLVGNGIDINMVEYETGHTPLMVAAKAGHESIVDHCLVHGANIHRGVHNGRTALMMASVGGHAGVVVKLIQLGANMNAANKEGITALMLASEAGKDQVVDHLLLAGANVHQCNQKDNDALCFAAGRGRSGIIQKLLKAGANVHHRNIQGCTALWKAAWTNNYESVQMLIAAGSNVDIRNNREELYLHFVDSLISPLMIASQVNDIKTVSLLLTSRAVVDLISGRNETALSMAVRRNHVKVSSLLIDAGAKTSGLSHNGCFSALQLFIQSFDGRMVNYGDMLALLLREYPKLHFDDHGRKELDRAYIDASSEHFKRAINDALVCTRDRKPIVNLNRRYRLL